MENRKTTKRLYVNEKCFSFFVDFEFLNFHLDTSLTWLSLLTYIIYILYLTPYFNQQTNFTSKFTPHSNLNNTYIPSVFVILLQLIYILRPFSFFYCRKHNHECEWLTSLLLIPFSFLRSFFRRSLTHSVMMTVVLLPVFLGWCE